MSSDLLNTPVRPQKEEICEHCGETFTGLFHCQSITQIKMVDGDFLIGKLSEWTPPDREVVTLTTLDSPVTLVHPTGDKKEKK